MKNLSKKWWLYTIIVLIIIVISLIGIFCYNQNKLNKKLLQKDTEYSKLVNSKQKLEQKLDEETKLVAQLEQREKQQEIQNKIRASENQKRVIENDIDSLNKNKQSLQNDVNNLKNDIIKIKAEPKTYPAGHLSAGTDFAIGRYKIYGGSSNFCVYSTGNDLKVNTILGGKYGVSEYIYKFENGDKIEANSQFKMVSIN